MAEPTAEKQDGLPKSMSAMMLPRAVALAKATALPLPASPVQDTPREAPARSSGNAMVRKRLHTRSSTKSGGVLASTWLERHNNSITRGTGDILQMQQAPVNIEGNCPDAARGEQW